MAHRHQAVRRRRRGALALHRYRCVAATPTTTATPIPSASHVTTPTPATAIGHGVLADKSAPVGTPTWESQPFTAPRTWTISYIYDSGGYGGHFTVAVLSDTQQFSPIDKRGDKGSGSVTVDAGGSGVTIAVDTTKDCSWHATARG